METAAWFIGLFFLLLFITLGYYFLVEQPKTLAKKKSNVIQLQTNGFDFIMYKGKIKEMVDDYHRYLADMDIVIYSKSIFIGFLEAKYTYVDLPAKAIHSIKYEPNKLTILCDKAISGRKKIIIKGTSTKDLYTIARKLDFIARRSKKASAI